MDFSETYENKQLKSGQIDLDILDKYIERNTSEKGILLIRRYYGITAFSVNGIIQLKNIKQYVIMSTSKKYTGGKNYVRIWQKKQRKRNSV